MGWNWGANEHPGKSSYLYTGCYWNFITRSISGADRRCIKPISTYARFLRPIGWLMGWKFGTKQHPEHYLFCIHRISMTFGHTPHLRYRTKLYWVHQNLPSTGCFLGEIWVIESSRGIIFSCIHSISMKFGHRFHLGCRTQVYQAHQNLRPNWVLLFMVWNWVADLHRLYILSVHRIWMSHVHFRSTVGVELYVLNELLDQWIFTPRCWPNSIGIFYRIFV